MNQLDLTNDFTCQELIQKHRRIKRELLLTKGLVPLRIAVLGGTTTDEFVTFAEILLLQIGIEPIFWQCDYGRYYESAVLDQQDLIAFKPDLVYINTYSVNIQNWPVIGNTEEDLAVLAANQITHLKSIWQAVSESIGCQIIQNNFDPSMTACLGNLDAISPGGRNRLVCDVNSLLVSEANANPNLILVDINTLSSRLGWANWFDPTRWFSYKLFLQAEANLELAKLFTATVGAIRGRSKKCLVLDLDNTLWGGVIGDDGIDGIVLGMESALGEAYLAFHKYCLEMKHRGILLAVCSKNTESNALMGFDHRDSVLKRSDFAAFFANWEPKSENIAAIAKTLNIGLDSLVFVDDNPAERDIVKSQLPMVGVPDVGDDVTRFVGIIEAKRYFETIGLSSEDAKRAQQYAQNAERGQAESKFANYADFLDSLKMSAEIDRLNELQIERTVQLVNKTNQFNLTTKRYTLAEMQHIERRPDAVCVYGRLEDKFGDNGLISVVIGQLRESALVLDLWIMSCRVLKREMEIAMLDKIVSEANKMGAKSLIGIYIPSAKNMMVEAFYATLGFTQIACQNVDNRTEWQLDLSNYTPRTKHILINSKS
jgi:FkbH-like protein